LSVPETEKDVGNAVFVQLPLWLDAFRNFRVHDAQTLALLRQALDPMGSWNVRLRSSAPVHVLFRLGQEVDSLNQSGADQKKCQAETLWLLAKMLQDEKQYGRSLAATALERLAITPQASSETKRDAILLALYAYSGERHSSNRDGSVLIRCVRAVCAIARASHDKCILQQPEWLFADLVQRCSAHDVLDTQKLLLDTAENLAIDEKSIAALRTELGCAYIMNGNYPQAEHLLEKSADAAQPQALMDSVYLAECLRRQKNFAECRKLCLQIVKESKVSLDQYAFQCEAVANEILGESFVDQDNLAAAAQPLEASENFFERNQLGASMFTFRQPNATRIVPSEKQNLELLATVYRDTANSSKLRQIELSEQALNKRDLEAEFSQLQDLLNNYVIDVDGSPPALLERANNFIDVCAKVDKSPEQRIDALFKYAESLIKHGHVEAAEHCLVAAFSGKFIEQFRDKYRLTLDRLWIAETIGDLQQAKDLVSSLPNIAVSSSKNHDATTPNPQPDHLALLAQELIARFDLMSGDYAGAELHSRDLQKALDLVPLSPMDSTDPSRSRDDFIDEHFEFLLDRAHACFQLRLWKDATVLLRRILRLSHRGHVECIADASALLALCYVETGHEGLANAAQKEAVHSLADLSLNDPTAAAADVYLRLAILESKDQNSVRRRRYLQTAKQIAAACHLQQTTLYTEICERMK
jgi:hypothetical protein